jgi:hypothetical protein
VVTIPLGGIAAEAAARLDAEIRSGQMAPGVGRELIVYIEELMTALSIGAESEGSVAAKLLSIGFIRVVPVNRGK